MKLILSLCLSLFACTPAWAVDYCADANIAGCWPMDTDESPVDDESANSNTGTHNGTPTFATADPPDTGDGTASNYQTGYWELNDDATDFFSFGTDSSLNITGTNFSHVAWVYSNFTTWEYFSDKKNGTDGGWLAGFEGSGNMEIVFYTTGTDYSYAHLDIADNQWEHVAYILRAGEICLYQNGTEQCNGLSTASMSTSASEPWEFGKQLARTCQVALFNDALTSMEVNDIMDNGLGFVASSATYSGRGIGRGISRGVMR